jgi:ATP-dependent Clp protease ATP-binding subunit ClpX
VTEKVVLCSFCGKSAKDVSKVVAGPDGVHICNECVDLAYDLVHGEPVGRR